MYNYIDEMQASELCSGVTGASCMCIELLVT